MRRSRISAANRIASKGAPFEEADLLPQLPAALTRVEDFRIEVSPRSPTQLQTDVGPVTKIQVQIWSFRTIARKRVPVHEATALCTVARM